MAEDLKSIKETDGLWTFDKVREVFPPGDGGVEHCIPTELEKLLVLIQSNPMKDHPLKQMLPGDEPAPVRAFFAKERMDVSMASSEHVRSSEGWGNLNGHWCVAIQYGNHLITTECCGVSQANAPNSIECSLTEDGVKVNFGGLDEGCSAKVTVTPWKDVGPPAGFVELTASGLGGGAAGVAVGGALGVSAGAIGIGTVGALGGGAAGAVGGVLGGAAGAVGGFCTGGASLGLVGACLGGVLGPPGSAAGAAAGAAIGSLVGGVVGGNVGLGVGALTFGGLGGIVGGAGGGLGGGATGGALGGVAGGALGGAVGGVGVGTADAVVYGPAFGGILGLLFSFRKP
uniref:Uncharacterized protein n=1 Tax=Chromera velia CCMP2878 TaxID=1169474 RepID=A0A0G4FBP8_9ALVE|eukprot:Cvel_16066.t1-p1 / transcript=Cvel_16066.t1 / gene=Cvel_16066 / organism=Chromera_velia_CCMP2878 / gene_product=hypothetical protein / transcript_product=hypothetical protein / location=Cvel_scaffold1221:16590-17853(+) / protein_length=342 / sequence_SO=supercontig / SO=protein_coding / is_pseudo=false